MKFLVTVDESLEKTAASEIKACIHAKPVIRKQALLFDAAPDTVALLSQQIHTAKNIILLLHEFSFSSPTEFFSTLRQKLLTTELEKWLLQHTCVFMCSRSGTHAFTTADIFSHMKLTLQEHKQVRFQKGADDRLCCVVVDNTCYLGIDFCGGDIGKRMYRLFAKPTDVTGALAYHMLSFAGYTGKESLLVAHCSSGTVLIEATLFSSTLRLPRFCSFFSSLKKSVSMSALQPTTPPVRLLHGFDTVPHIKAAERNAKLAQAHHLLKLSTSPPSLPGQFSVIIVRLLKTERTKIAATLSAYCGLLQSKGSVLLFSTAPVHMNEDSMKKTCFVLRKQEVCSKGTMHYHLLLFAKR